MSLCYKLLALENGIPFKDVHASWRQRRRRWAEAVSAETDCAPSLASPGLELLFVMTPEALNRMWGITADHKSLCDTLAEIADGRRADVRGEALRRALASFEAVALPQPLPSERSLLEQGEEDELPLGDPGPDLRIGSRCVALDITNCWCVPAPRHVCPASGASSPLHARASGGRRGPRACTPPPAV